MRLKFLEIIIVMVFIFLLSWLFNMQVVNGDKFISLSDKNCIRLIPQEGKRGDILDRNGQLLVGSTISYDLLILPQDKSNLDFTLNALSSVLLVPFNELKDRYKKNYISKNMPVVIAKNIDRQKALMLEELKFNYDGVRVQPRPIRYYPYGSLAAHLIGYLSQIDQWRLTKLEFYGYKVRDIVGYGGIEEKYDYYLRQEDGGVSQEVDHRGKLTRLLGYKPPKSGKDIQLTIDYKIQKIVEDSLENRKGSVVMMDPNTGEIIALASGPTFDPSIFVKKKSNDIVNLYRDTAAPMLNRAISGTYPPGSVFKVVDAVAALELNKVTPDTSYFCPGYLAVGKRNFKCWSTHNDQNLEAALAHSCDVYFYKIGLSVTPNVLHDYSSKFGLGKVSGVELPYENSGFIPSPLWKKITHFQNWYDGDTANFSIGQGAVMTSPLQLARLMAVFANDGKLVTPYLVKSIEGKDVTKSHRKISDLHVKSATIEAVRKGLRAVVAWDTGTSNILSTMPVSVAGKTGTAQTSRNENHAWFVGFFPYDNPKYVISVFLERGGHGYLCCVLAKQIIETMNAQGLL